MNQMGRLRARSAVLALCATIAAAAIWQPGLRAQIAPGSTPGPAGPAGTAGSVFFMQASPPAPALGAAGDVAVDTLTSNVYQKSAGGWAGPLMNIQGPQGAAGAAGSAGAAGAQGAQGVAGAQGIPGAQGTPGAQGSTGATGATGPAGTAGATGATGPAGSAGATGPAGATGGFSAYGQPTARTFALGTAYQCTDNTRPCILTVTLASTAALSLTAGATNQADLVLGTSSGIASSGGTRIAQYSNSLTGTLVIGLAINTNSNVTYTLNMPAAGFMAIRQTSGTVSIVNSSVEQTVI